MRMESWSIDMDKIFKIIRKITIPPVFAVVLFTVVYIAHPDYFGSIWHLIGALCLVALLPTLAYPLQRFISKFKDKGRDGQRTLAMIFSFAGYLLGVAVAFIFAAPVELKMIYLEYLLCGIGIILFNKVLKIKASGHACGIVGPIIMLAYLGMYIPAIIETLFVVPVYVSSVRTKQHTVSQLIVGSIIPAVVLLILIAVRYFFFDSRII